MLKANLLALASTAALLAACGGGDESPAPEAQAEEPEKLSPAPTPMASEVDPVDAALASPSRPADQVELDAARKPGAVVRLMGVGEGSRVVDLNGGTGYYAEILSPFVGPEGEVILHNDEFYGGFVRDRLAGRFDDAVGQNVDVIEVPLEELAGVVQGVDSMVYALAYHDMFVVREGETAPVADHEAALASIFEALKPGGTFVVIDHVAMPGDVTEAANTVHRIAPATVKAQVEAAGFSLMEVSDVLMTGEDDYTINVFDPSVRRKTDRFVFKFQKPAE